MRLERGKEGESLSIGTVELCVTPNGDGIGFRAIIDELGETGCRFGEYLCVDCGNLPCLSGHSQLANTKFTKPNTKISKSDHRSRSTDGRLKRRLSLTLGDASGSG